MTRSSENKSATPGQKHQAHQTLDTLWQSSAFTEADRQNLRSLIYRLWAAVIMGQEKTFDTRGIFDPFVGDHHIAHLKAKYHEPLKKFLGYILFDQNGGSTTKLSSSLVKWFEPLNKAIKASSSAIVAQEIEKNVEADKLILTIRKHLGFSKTESEIAKSKQVESKDELGIEESEAEQTPLNIKLSKEPKSSSMEDIFLDALMADIEGDEIKAQKLYEEAEDRGYKEVDNNEQKPDATKLALQKNIQDSTFFAKLIFYKKTSPKKVLGYVEKMAKSNNSHAQIELGIYYLYGENVKQDDKMAFEYFKLAADQGNSKAQFNLGNCYIQGLGVKKNDKMAVKLYRLSADQGIPEAQHNLGVSYEQGKVVKKNAEMAVKLYRLAAEQGLSTAQFNLGVCYAEGNGVKKNEEMAVEFYRLAADQGLVNAQCNLGVCYEHGRGVKKNDEMAVELFKLAAMKGNSGAQFNMGIRYEKGRGVKKNAEMAFEFYRLAADQGNLYAQFNLGAFYSTGEGVAKNDEKAVEYFRLAADQGHVKAQYHLGCCYLQGKGVEKDDEMAVESLKLAAEQGHSVSQYNLGICYLEGTGIEKNFCEAERLLELAAKAEIDNQKILTDVKQNAGIEKKIKSNHMLISQFISSENKDSGTDINPKILRLIRQNHELCKKHIATTKVEFGSKITEQYNAVNDFINAREKDLPSVSISTKSIAVSPLQQSQARAKSNK